MSRRLVTRRQRLVRVREAQHAMAIAETIRAKDVVQSLSDNAARVARVRGELFEAQVAQMGGSFAAHRELADRLEKAGKQLEGAIYDAHKVVNQKQDMQVSANRDREIALRLKDRARALQEAQMEARIAAITRYRRMKQQGE
ncbi:MAG: hypothetical protein E2598_12855 [Sphingobium sp.]|nr:hypothetical protein [Sphingobium sp.]